MWRDPYCRGSPRQRAAYAARFNHDIKATCHAAREEQKRSLHEVVSLQPRRVATTMNLDARPAVRTETADAPDASPTDG